HIFPRPFHDPRQHLTLQDGLGKRESRPIVAGTFDQQWPLPCVLARWWATPSTPRALCAMPRPPHPIPPAPPADPALSLRELPTRSTPAATAPLWTPWQAQPKRLSRHLPPLATHTCPSVALCGP